MFTATRVPGQTLFWHVEKGITIRAFLADFPGVTEEQAVKVLDIAGKLLSSGQIEKLEEAVA